MKRMSIGIMLFLLGTLFSIEAQVDDDFEVQQLSNGTLSVTGYKGSAGVNIVIPSKIYGTPVSKIDYSTFQGKTDIRTVTISQGIKQIGMDNVPTSYQFYSGSIRTLNLPQGLQTIGHYALTDHVLFTLTIPTTVTTIGESAFRDNVLTEITIPTNVKTVGVAAFKGNKLDRVILKSVFEITSRWGRATIFEDNPVTNITIPANWPDKSLPLLGFESNFDNFYISQQKKAGTYYKQGPVWKYSDKPVTLPALDSAEAYIARAKEYWGKNDAAMALADYASAIKLSPNTSNYYIERNSWYQGIGLYDKAIDDISQAIKLEPVNHSFYRTRADLFITLKNFDKAIADTNEAIKIKPDFAAAFNTRGVVYWWKEDYEKAIADFNEAINLDPANEQYKKNLESVQKLK
jgi:hypothetical protein